MKVFISYRHDSTEQMSLVRRLVDRLRFSGIDTHADRDTPDTFSDSPRWVAEQIRSADFVLVVLSKDYFHRVESREKSGKALGILWEAALYNHLHHRVDKTQSFIPVLAGDGDPAYFPLPLKDVKPFRVDTENGLEALYQRLRQPSMPPQLEGKVAFAAFVQFEKDWPATNRERCLLIDKEISGTLTSEEAARLMALQAYASYHVQQVAPRPTHLLEELERHVAALEDKAPQQ